MLEEFNGSWLRVTIHMRICPHRWLSQEVPRSSNALNLGFDGLLDETGNRRLE